MDRESPELRRFRGILDQMPLAVAVFEGPDHVIVSASKAYRRVLGGREVVGLPAVEALPDFVAQGFLEDLERAFRTGETVTGSAVRAEFDSDGDGLPEANYIDFTCQPLRDEQGQVWGVVTGVVNVTAREQAGQAQRASDQRLRQVLDALPLGVCLASLQGEVLYANQALGHSLGLGEGALEGRLAELAPAVGPELDEALRVAAREGRWTGRLRIRSGADAREVTLEVLVGRMVNPAVGGELLYGIFRDISGQLQVERQLRQSERLASLGTLVSGVAHELNNPLSAVLGFTELLLMEDRPQAERDDLETIRRESERMAKIVADLRVIARGMPEEGLAERVDLNDVVRHVLKTRAHAIKRNRIELREDLALDLPAVLADRGRIEQAVLNLVVNAEQAMSGMEGERRLILRTRPTAQGATLQVVDNGPGIPPRHLERIFDPFFTTKSPGEGTGLGLALVHTIIAEHHGEIRVDSEVGAGTAFRMDLPRALAGAAVESPAPEVVESSGRLRVLVVDDENAVRRVLMRYLSRLGCDTEEAADGGQALNLIDWAEIPFDVVISDLRMPGLSGEELFVALAERGIADRVIFLTGDTASADSARTLADVDAPMLSKPISMEALGRALEEVTRSRTT